MTVIVVHLYTVGLVLIASIIISNCEFFYDSQSFDNAIITAHHTQLHQHSQSLDSQCRKNPQNAIIKPRIKNRSYGNVYGICTCTACTLICIIILLREEPAIPYA